MKIFSARRLLGASAAALLCAAASLLPASAQGAPQAAAPQDMGPANAAQTSSVSIVLKLRHPQALEAYVRSVSDPGSGLYRHYLTTAQFAHRFAPTPRQVQRIANVLKRYGIQVDGVSDSRLILHATGTTAQFNAAFATQVRRYRHHGHVFHRPDRRPRAPATLADQVQVIAGLSNEPLFHPMSARAAAAGSGKLVAPKATLPKPGTVATGVPGDYTVGDLANRYDINPLYNHGIDGAGETVGIVTLANFIPADAYTYWSMINLPVKPDRITQVHVDGGGPLGSAAGSGETTLDVEQAGGVAPQADIVVYDAPNTDAGFIDAFATAVAQNKADTLSVSWGSPEAFYFDSPLTGGDYTGELQAFHEIFLEAAVQGISIFASSGDSGAYDTNRALPYPNFTKTLSVDAPASDPLITAAGGTTTPLTLSAGPGTPQLVVSQEQAWSWTYIDDYLVKVFGPQYKDADFSVGGGGGVSSYWAKPFYQWLTPGMRRTEAGQSLGQINADGSVTTFLTLPAHFRGRNLPDVSLDADPYSGYLVYSSLDGGLISGYGGTSFVAPQLNGIAALIDQASGHRVGFVNPALYTFHWLYRYGERSPLRDVTAGNNWFYQGRKGYDPASGLGTLDVTHLARAFAPFGLDFDRDGSGGWSWVGHGRRGH